MWSYACIAAQFLFLLSYVTRKEKRSAYKDEGRRDKHSECALYWLPDFSSTLLLAQAMGFTKAKSKAALEECGNDVQSALDWLVTNCI